MKGYYEKNRENDLTIMVSRNKNHTFKAHYHSNIEVFVIKSGTYALYINGEKYSLKDGDIAVIDSYDIHSYQKTSSNNDDCVFIFPVEYSNIYSKLKGGLKAEYPIISNKNLSCALLELGDRLLANSDSRIVSEGGARLFFALIYEHLSYTARTNYDTDNLMRNVFDYIYNHYNQPINLSTVSKALGYSREHISREFKRYTNSTVGECINSLRYDYVIKNSDNDKTVAELIYEAGFNSIQTYYRYRKKLKKITI